MSLNSGNIKRLPHWVTTDYASLLHLSEARREWLLDNLSLTQRIKSHCLNSQLGCFSVRVLHQGMKIPSTDEINRLKLKNRRYALIREVLLFCGNSPLIYARTVIPIKTLTGKQRQLAHLGNKPLGAFLFAQSYLQRDVMEVATLSSGHQLFESAVANLQHPPANIWGRRSVFRLRNKPLLVAEVFLPGLIE